MKITHLKLLKSINDLPLIKINNGVNLPYTPTNFGLNLTAQFKYILRKSCHDELLSPLIHMMSHILTHIFVT